MKHVFLGRFAPFHEGHKMLLTRLIDRFGIENCLVMIGSSNVINERTPYTKEQRRDFVKKEFPNVETLFVEDVGDDGLWLQNVKSIEARLGEELVFYGGSKEDLKILSRQFKTKVLVDRMTEGKGISATKIREQLKHSQ